MKITIENTSKIVELNGLPGRIWEGYTENGVPVIAFISRIATPVEEDQEEFKRDLQETKPPSPDVEAFPMRLLI